MKSTTKLLAALAAAAIALPVAAQTPAPKGAAERTGQETPVKAKTPEQVAKEKADQEKIRADARASGVKGEADKKGQAKMQEKKTPEQLAKEKADKAKRGTTPEEQAKQSKTLPGG